MHHVVRHSDYNPHKVGSSITVVGYHNYMYLSLEILHNRIECNSLIQDVVAETGLWKVLCAGSPCAAKSVLIFQDMVIRHPVVSDTRDVCSGSFGPCLLVGGAS